jgi:hypothetical protein
MVQLVHIVGHFYYFSINCLSVECSNARAQNTNVIESQKFLGAIITFFVYRISEMNIYVTYFL